MIVIRYGLILPDELPPAAITRSKAVNASVPKSFYDRLIRSVSMEGFRNPVLFNNMEGEMAIIYGESRAWVAHKLGVALPAFINDGVGQFEHFELIRTEQQAREKFKDRPTKFRLGPPLFFWGCPTNYG